MLDQIAPAEYAMDWISTHYLDIYVTSGRTWSYFRNPAKWLGTRNVNIAGNDSHVHRLKGSIAPSREKVSLVIFPTANAFTVSSHAALQWNLAKHSVIAYNINYSDKRKILIPCSRSFCPA